MWEHNNLYEKAGLKTREVLKNPSTPEEIAEAKKAPIPPACNEAYLSENRSYYITKKNPYMPKVLPSCWYDFLQLDPVEHINEYIIPASNYQKKEKSRWRQRIDTIWLQLETQSPKWDQIMVNTFEERVNALNNEGIIPTWEEESEIKYQVYKEIEHRYRIYMLCKFDFYLKEFNFFGRLNVDYYYKAREEFVENGKVSELWVPRLFLRNDDYEERLKKEREEEGK